MRRNLLPFTTATTLVIVVPLLLVEEVFHHRYLELMAMKKIRYLIRFEVEIISSYLNHLDNQF